MDPKIVMIIDDDEDLAKLIDFAFKAEGINTKIFYEGTSAIKFLNNSKNVENIELIILDRLLPDMDGIEILKEFKKINNKNIPVLILSILSADEDVLKGLKLGAVDYISKPFNLYLLIEKSMKLMKLK